MECLSQQKIVSTRVSAPAQSPQDDSLFQGSESISERYSMSHIETEVAIVCVSKHDIDRFPVSFEGSLLQLL